MYPYIIPAELNPRRVTDSISLTPVSIYKARDIIFGFDSGPKIVG